MATQQKEIIYDNWWSLTSKLTECLRTSDPVKILGRKLRRHYRRPPNSKKDPKLPPAYFLVQLGTKRPGWRHCLSRRQWTDLIVLPQHVLGSPQFIGPTILCCVHPKHAGWIIPLINRELAEFAEQHRVMFQIDPLA